MEKVAEEEAAEKVVVEEAAEKVVEEEAVEKEAEVVEEEVAGIGSDSHDVNMRSQCFLHSVYPPAMMILIVQSELARFAN